MSDKQEQLIAESRGYWGYRELTEEELKRVSGSGCGGGCGCGCGAGGGADDGSDSAAADTTSQNNDGTEATNTGESPVTTSPTGPDTAVISVDNRDGTTSIAVTGPNGIDPSSVTTVGPDAREGGEDQP